MKKIRITLLIIAIIGCFLLVGCDTTTGGEDGVGDKIITQLETPQNVRIVQYSGNPILFFDLVEKAVNYQITIFKNGLYHDRIDVTTDEAVLGILLKDYEEGEYSATIKAIADSSTNILNSQSSEAIIFLIDNSGDISKTKYNVVFDTNGGTQITTQIVSSGNKATKPTNPTKKGYEFVSWLLNGTEYDFNEPITSNITLVANWKVSNNPDDGNIELTDYYLTTKDLTGNALKTKLRSIISDNVKNTSYSFLTSSNGLPYTDADPEISGNIILFYGKVSVKSNSGWNREHVWPKSRGWFNTSGAGSDIHHIRPEEVNVNSRRGNLIMGVVNGGKNNQYNNGMSGGYYSGSWYEPLDLVKGDIARIYMYMLIRYAQTDSAYPITNVISSMQLLLEWHNIDPVDEFERVRNERSYEVQGNRNPFIDYPEFAQMIWG